MSGDHIHSGGGDVVKLEPTKPEAEIAAEFKQSFEAAAVPLLAIMDAAVAAGLLVQFDGIAVQPPYGKHRLLNLRIAKNYY